MRVHRPGRAHEGEFRAVPVARAVEVCPEEGYDARTRKAGHIRRRQGRAGTMLVWRIPLSMTAQEASGSRVSSPSTRRQIPSGFSSRSSGGRVTAGAFCHATGRRKRRIAVMPTDVWAGADVAG
jgi:hypothetical protein